MFKRKIGRKSKAFILTVILCTISIFFSSIPVYRADTFTNVNEATEYATIRLNELRMQYSSSQKELGNMPTLIKLYAQFIIVLDFVENNVMKNTTSGYDYILSQSLYNEYVNYADSMAREINKLYNGAEYDGEDGANPISTSIENRTVEFWLNDLKKGSFTLPAKNKTSNRYRDEIVHIFNDYIIKMFEVTTASALSLSAIEEIPQSMSEEDINKVINTHKGALSNLTVAHSTILSNITAWNTITITGASQNKMNDPGASAPSWVAEMVKQIQNSGTSDGKAPGSVTLKNANSVLAMLTNTEMVNGELVVEGDTPNLTNLGYVLIASGCVYDPFVSTAGNDLYIETVREFITSEEQWDNATNIIKKAVSMKKPLYVASARETSSSGTASDAATYRLALLSDLMDLTEYKEDKVLQFSVLKGQMSPSTVDSSTYEYVQSFGTSGSTTTELENGTVEVTDSTQSGNAAADSKYTTVGSTSLVAGNSEMTEPVMYASSLNGSKVSNDERESKVLGNTTSAILYNARKDAKNNNSLINADKGMLFLNGLGDVVLSDDTVILPAIANPTLYNYDNLLVTLATKDSSGSVLRRNGTEFDYDGEQEKGYYPYTATFMNHTPEVKISGESQDKLAFANGKNKNKFVIFALPFADITDGIGYRTMVSKITSASTEKASIDSKQSTIIPLNIHTLSVGEEGYEKNNASPFRIFELGQKLSKNLIGMAKNASNKYFYKDEVYNSSKIPFFPIVEGDNLSDLLTVTAPLVTSARRYIAVTQDGSDEWLASGTFKVDYLIENMISEALLGTQYASTIAKNAISSYEDIVNDSPRRFEKFLTGVTEDIIKVLGRIDGVLAMHTGYENTVFADIVQFISVYYVFIAIILVVIVATKFLQNKLSMPYMLFISAIVVASFEIYVSVLPTFLPEAYNFFVNDLVENVSWNSVYNAAENYSETYLTPNRVSANGEEKPYTSTVTLYQLSNQDIKNAAARLGVDEIQIKTGDIIYLDEAAGIFLEGNRIKMSLDTALSNKTLRGLYKSQWDALEADQNITLDPIEVVDINENPYQIRYVNGAVSLDSYYTPYNEFIQYFVNNLNTMSSIFNIQRNTFNYDKNLSKDAFMVNSYIHSGLFLDPGNWETLQDNIVQDSLTEGDYSLTSIKELVEKSFQNPDDWLGMANWILTPTDDMKETLWARTLQQNGYYENNWTPTDKMNDLITYVNNHTQKFIVNNVDLINYCSDENAIKLISLFATTALCDRASQFTSWMYPNYLNSADIELEDVLYASMTTLQDRNMVVEDSLVATIAYVYGVVGLLLLIVVLFFSNIFIFVLTYFVPILYLLLGLMLVFKLVVARDTATTVKGYLKISIFTIILYFIYNCSLTVASKLGHHWFALIFVSLSSFLCCWFLAFTIMSVATNVTDLGNASLKANLLRASNMVTAGVSSKLHAKFKNMFATHNTQVAPAAVYNNYGHKQSIDNMPVSRGTRNVRNYKPKNTYSPYRKKHIGE